MIIVEVWNFTDANNFIVSWAFRICAMSFLMFIDLDISCKTVACDNRCMHCKYKDYFRIGKQIPFTTTKITNFAVRQPEICTEFRNDIEYETSGNS